jgi:hypothetical protein
MNNETAALYWLEVNESVPVRLGDLARMMARAQFPGDNVRAALHRTVSEESIAGQLVLDNERFSIFNPRALKAAGHWCRGAV